MAQLVLNNISSSLLIKIGDALLSEGAPEAAAHTFRTAMGECAPGERGSILSRLGIAETEPTQARPLLTVLQAIEAEFPNRGAFVTSGMALWLRTHSFLDDPRFIEIAAKHSRLLPIPNWHWNLNAALWAAWQAKDLDGDFVELGVFKGHTTLFLAEYLEFQNQSRKWWLYDTFDGIPEDQLNAGWSEVNKALYKDTYSVEEVRGRFADFPNIEVIKGRVPEALDHAPRKIAFLHMDMNSAVAEIAALDALYDRIVPGGVILFDDYAWLTASEQHTAERDWMAERGQRILELPTGQGVFIKPA